MISSKELLEITGISRATLNNYISMGILQRPNVLAATREQSGAPRLGFFPDNAVEIIEQVQQLKSEGLNMAEIRSRLASGDNTEKPTDEDEQPKGPSEEASMSDTKSKSPAALRFEQLAPSSMSVDLSLDTIPGPAYMVNNNFELTWWNEQAEKVFFDLDDVIDRDIASRNIFHLVLNREHAHAQVNFPQLLEITMSAAKKRMTARSVAKVYPQLESEDVKLMNDLFERTQAIGDEDITHYAFELNDQAGQHLTHTLYVCFFREGVFFSYLPADEDSSALINLLSQRNRVIQDIMRKRRPFLTNLVTMVADLQDSMHICSELPAEEYFELINGIWQRAEPIFRRYQATHGKHVGDGMVYYFLPQPDSDYILNSLCCAYELREMMRDMSREWQSRKNWSHELRLNVGLNEGQEWFGTYHAGTHLEFTVLGDTINHASRLSDFAREGSIWVTKSMLSKVTRDKRRHIRYGIYREDQQGHQVLSPELFARVSGLLDLSEGKNYKFQDIAALPVAQLVDLELSRCLEIGE